MAKLLIVEDEEKLARFIELELIHEGYEVEKTGNGLTACEIVSRKDPGEAPFDLMLLDIMLPGINGMEVLRRLNIMEKDQGIKIPPVIILTARDQVMDKVAGLDAGAVDYITKPFAIEELLARIRVALKIHGSNKETAEDSSANKGSELLCWRDLTLDRMKHRVTYAGEEIPLTNREFLMLLTLLENRDIVLSRDSLLSKVCGYDYVGETNIIDVYVRYLRTKIDEAFNVKMIQTVRGVGYVIYSDTK